MSVILNPFTGQLELTGSGGGGGTGNVSGPNPGASTDDAIVRWNGSTGRSIQDSSVIIDDSNNITGVQDLNSQSLHTQAITVASLSGVVKSVAGLFSASTIVNADVSASASISYSKLSLSNSIVNADISTSAAIVYSKLSLSNSILNADINTSAAIVLTKLAALTNHNRALVSDNSGFITEANTSTTEINYVAGVTSGIQNQLDGKQITGNYITDLTGDVVASGPGSAAATIQPGTINNSKVSNTAAIAYSKLALTNSVVNADIASAAAIAYSKLATLGGSTNSVLIQNSSGFVTPSAILSTNLFLADGSVLATSDLNLNNHKLINVTDPSSAQDAATKAYVDALAQGINSKAAVFVATTANITLAGEQTIDGTLTSSSRVLVKDQTLSQFNGIYVSSAGAWTRSTDANTWNELVSAFIFVEEGSVQADSGWLCNVDPGGTIGVTPVTFVQFSQAGVITTDNQGITKTGSVISLVLDSTTLSKSATGLKVATGGITNTEVSNSAAIAYSKLSLTGSIVNADISASAAIVYSKLSLTGSIVNADINNTAAIALTKLAALTNHNRALVSDASGFITESTSTSTEVGFLSGVTSAIQTQLDNKATITLNNLGTTSINADLLPSATNTRNLGSASLNFATANVRNIAAATDISLNANATANNVNISSALFKRSSDGTNFIEEQYVHSITLTNNVSNTAITNFTFAFATYYAQEISFIVETTTGADVRIGKLFVATNGTVTTIVETMTETADVGVLFSSAINGSNVEVRYTTTNLAGNRTMRADIKRFLK